MARPKGQPKIGGRKKGTPNKHPAELKDMIRQALSEVGGVDYLKTQAFANPTAFLSLLGKTMPPASSTFDGELRIVREIRVAFVDSIGERHSQLESTEGIRTIMPPSTV